jgi:hypothetical protein
MTTATFTLLHVLISLAGIGSGFIVMFGLLAGKPLNRWTALFLSTTVATSATGFLFPIKQVTPGLVIGAISLVVLAVAILARYRFRLSGAWRRTYVISAALASYFNTFVLVVQSFEKVPALKALAPTQKEPPFMIAQLVVLAVFLALTYGAAKGFRAEPLRVISARAA